MTTGAVDPLSGVVVLDFTQFLAGPYCTQILGDLGADVIKIERPGKGEVYRTYGPKFIEGESTSFLACNRNKRSLALDLSREGAREVARRLVEKADVLVENFKVGTMEKFGLGYEDAAALNPRLVYCSVSGFGSAGPYRERGGFDLVAQGMSGLMAVTGEPGRPPVKVGYPVTDIGGGMYAAIGILAALLAREKTGRGQFVDTSLFETGVAWGLMAAVNYFADGTVPGPLGSASPQNAPYQAFQARDGAFTVGTGNDELWRRFCQVFGIEHLLEDPRYRDNASRVENQESLAEAISAVVSQLTVADCLQRLEEAGIPCGPINTLDRVLEDPQVKARGLVVEMEHPRAGKVKNIFFPVKLSGTPARVRRAPPLLGEHTAEILQWLGYTEAEIANLRAAGVVA